MTDPRTRPAREPRPTAALLGLLLFLLAVLPGLPGLNGDFIGDDRIIILNNPALRDPGHLPRLFGETYWGDAVRAGLYRPITLASYLLDRLAWGPGPGGAPKAAGVHLGNLLWNGAAALLLFAWLRRRWRSTQAPFWAAALFAVHPAHTEAVIHMVGRADVLMTAACLAAFLLVERGGRVGRPVAALAFLAALLAKEMAAALPLLLLLDTWVRRGERPWRAAWRERAPDLALWLCALLAYLLLRGHALGAAETPPRAFVLYVPGQYLAFQDPRPGEVFWTMIHAFGEYLRLLVFPLRLSADYSGFPHSAGPDGAVLLSLLALAAVGGAVAAAALRGRREPTWWLGWALLAFAPASNILAMTGIIMAERVLYLPSVAVAAAGGAALAALSTRFRAGALAAGALLVGLGALGTALRAPVWSDARRLNEVTLATSPFAGHLTTAGVALELLREDDRRHDPALLERALPLARASVRARANLTNVQYLAEILLRLQQYEESLTWWQTLLRFSPDDAPIRGQVLEILARLADDAESRGDRAGALRHTHEGFETAVIPADRAAWQVRLNRLLPRLTPESGSGGPPR